MGTDMLDQEMERIGNAGMLKRAYRDQRKRTRRTQRKLRRKHYRCFVTWPFRHEWLKDETDDGRQVHVCVGCGKEI